MTAAAVTAMSVTSAAVRALGKYRAVGSINLTNQLAYVLDAALRSIWMLVVMFVFAALWRTTYGALGTRSIDGLALPQMLGYLVVTESIIMSAPRLTRQVSEDVKTGLLAIELLRPYRYVPARYAAFLGQTALPLGVNLLAGGLVAGVGAGLPHLTWGSLTGGAISLWLALTLLFCNQMAIGLLAFWVEETSGIALVYDRVVWILGGMLLPVTLFPKGLAALAAWLPFKAIFFAPALTIVDFRLSAWVELAVVQAAWVVLFAGVCGWLYRRGVAVVHANGG